MVKVGVAQIKVFSGLSKNVKQVLKFLDLASAEEADIVCFPESCLGDEILSLDSSEIRLIGEKCGEKRVYCIVGVHLRIEGSVYNSAVLFNRAGGLEYVYRKNHLFPNLDLEASKPGEESRVIKTDFGDIGIIICWDFAFPEFVRALSKGGAEIIFCPSYLLNDARISKSVYRSYPLVRAFENLCYFVTCDAFTDEVFGESFICSPFKVINKIRGREGIIFAELDLSEIKKLRNFYDHLK